MADLLRIEKRGRRGAARRRRELRRDPLHRQHRRPRCLRRRAVQRGLKVSEHPAGACRSRSHDGRAGWLVVGRRVSASIRPERRCASPRAAPRRSLTSRARSTSGGTARLFGLLPDQADRRRADHSRRTPHRLTLRAWTARDLLTSMPANPAAAAAARSRFRRRRPGRAAARGRSPPNHSAPESLLAARSGRRTARARPLPAGSPKPAADAANAQTELDDRDRSRHHEPRDAAGSAARGRRSGGSAERSRGAALSASDRSSRSRSAACTRRAPAAAAAAIEPAADRAHPAGDASPADPRRPGRHAHGDDGPGGAALAHRQARSRRHRRNARTTGLIAIARRPQWPTRRPRRATELQHRLADAEKDLAPISGCRCGSRSRLNFNGAQPTPPPTQPRGADGWRGRLWRQDPVKPPAWCRAAALSVQARLDHHAGRRNSSARAISMQPRRSAT